MSMKGNIWMYPRVDGQFGMEDGNLERNARRAELDSRRARLQQQANREEFRQERLVSLLQNTIPSVTDDKTVGFLREMLWESLTEYAEIRDDIRMVEAASQLVR